MKTRHLVLASMFVPVVAGGCDPEANDPCADKKPGTICTAVGTHMAGLGADGLPGDETDLYLPQDITIGPDNLLYVVDWNNHRIRVVNSDGTLDTVIGTGYLGDALDPSTGAFEGKPEDINLNHPTHVLFAPNGDMIISAWHNSQVLRMSFEEDKVTRVCGTGARNFNGDDKPPKDTFLDLPVATAWAADGSLLIADQANQRIRKITVDGSSETMSTVVGTGEKGYSGDGGPAKDAKIQLPTSQSAPPAGRMITDSEGRIYLADTVNNVVRKVDTDGIITTIAGTGSPGNGGDGAATACALNAPSDVALDQQGNVYIADTMNSCVRKVSPTGQISTAVGTCGQRGFKGDGGPVANARLDRPYGIEVAADGTLYIADTHNNNIRVVYPE